MAMVDVGHSSLQADSQPKSVGLIDLRVDSCLALAYMRQMNRVTGELSQ